MVRDVGADQFGAFFATIDRVLAPGGEIVFASRSGPLSWAEPSRVESSRCWQPGADS